MLFGLCVEKRTKNHEAHGESDWLSRAFVDRVIWPRLERPEVYEKLMYSLRHG